jgi:glutaredoxin-related protein
MFQLIYTLNKHNNWRTIVDNLFSKYLAGTCQIACSLKKHDSFCMALNY